MHHSQTPGESFGSTSSTLLARAQANDPLAWQRLVELYSPLVYFWCRRGRLQAADAADVVQDVFHAVARSLDRFQHETERGSFRGWLRRIALNKLHDQSRFRDTNPPAEGGSANHERMQELTAEQGEFDPEAPAGPDENWLVLRGALDVFRVDFEDATWQAFWGTTIDNRPAADVALDLGITVNAVYKAKARVLSRLRTELRLLVDLRQMGRDG
jgi:RNA polymerase sigma-70 factor, ECF subfamily